MSHPAKPVATAIFAVVLFTPAPGMAQTPPLWQELGQDLLAAKLATSRITLAGDVDGNGTPDVLFGIDGQNRLFLNNGLVGFTEATATHLPPSTLDTQALLLFDADGDGDLDLIEAANPGQKMLYKNDGTGTFTLFATFGTLASTVAFGAADVDGDGDLDLVTGNATDPDSLGFNNGDGTFTGANGLQFPRFLGPTRSMQFADVDGDLDLDLLTNNRLLLNDGSGTFTEVPAAQYPTSSSFGDVYVADVDGDMDLDAYVDRSLLINDGTGTFTRVLPVPLASGALLDVDNDGDPDIISGDLFRFGSARTLLLNDGTGSFTDVSATQLPPAARNGGSFAVLDVFGTGAPDLVFSNGKFYLNDGNGTFAPGSRRVVPPTAERLWDTPAADLDGDGDQDLLLVQDDRDQVWLNDGTGHFDAVLDGVPASSSHNANRATFADLDNDGDLDVIEPLRTSPTRPVQLLNDGTGTFTAATQTNMPQLNGFQSSASAGDVDNDGDVDLVIAVEPAFGFGSGNNYLLLNNGSGVFSDATAGRLPTVVDSSKSSHLEDFDGDGDLDVFFANGGSFQGEQNRLYANNGTGTFTEVTAAALPTRTENSTGSVTADLDGDGDLDLVLSQERPTTAVRVLLNNGSGVFIDQPNVPVMSAVRPRVFVADADDDGDVDIFLTERGFVTGNVLLLNDGNAGFSLGNSLLPNLSGESLLLVADLDGDRDNDMVVGSIELGVRALANVTRQIDVPLRPRVGGLLRYHVKSRIGSPAFLVVALAERIPGITVAPIAGTLRVDATLWTPLLAPNPSATVDVPLPNDPSLLGMNFFGQALFIDGPFLRDWNFSGLTRGRVF